MKFKIMPARKEDSDFIAEGIISAVGSEICSGLENRIKPGKGSVKELFSRLASDDNSQYSYLNSLIALSDNGRRAGVIVAYDGADLYGLRRAFINEYNSMSDEKLSESDFSDETSPDEIYIDTLMVIPEFRRQGIGESLIHEVEKKFHQIEKPLGLLVDLENENAKSLYEKLGFNHVDNRYFAGTEMMHMQKISM